MSSASPQTNRLKQLTPEVAAAGSRCVLNRSVSLASVDTGAARRSLFHCPTDRPSRDTAMEQNSPCQGEHSARRSDSESDLSGLLKCTLNKSANDEDLIGDFSKMYCLPRIVGKHSDLKSISSQTVSVNHVG